MLGFRSIATAPLGVESLAAAGVTTTLSAATGSFAETGIAALFQLQQLAAAGSLAVTGVAAAFQVRDLSSLGALAESGVAAAFQVQGLSGAGAFALGGQAAVSAAAMPAAPCAYLLAGMPALYSLDFNLRSQGSSISGGTFSRGRWQQMQRAIDAERTAERLARSLENRRRREARLAAAAQANARIKATRNAEDRSHELDAQTRRFVDNVRAVAGLQSVRDAVEHSTRMLATARDARHGLDQQDEEEAIALLLAA
jgi:hypothetical protein